MAPEEPFVKHKTPSELFTYHGETFSQRSSGATYHQQQQQQNNTQVNFRKRGISNYMEVTPATKKSEVHAGSSARHTRKPQVSMIPAKINKNSEN